MSDRTFRFDHIRSVLSGAAGRADPLLAFAYTADDVPDYLTRMRSVVKSAGAMSMPMVLLDTGAAAALGALQDSEVERQR